LLECGEGGPKLIEAEYLLRCRVLIPKAWCRIVILAHLLLELLLLVELVEQISVHLVEAIILLSAIET
jgi:hypothetical protein